MARQGSRSDHELVGCPCQPKYISPKIKAGGAILHGPYMHARSWTQGFVQGLDKRAIKCTLLDMTVRKQNTSPTTKEDTPSIRSLYFSPIYRDENATCWVDVQWMGCYLGQISKARGRDWCSGAMEAPQIEDMAWGSSLAEAKRDIRMRLKP